MIDLKAIDNRIKEIERRRSLLEDYKEIPYEEFVSDFSTYELAIRHLQVAIQACIDIGTHIAAVKNFPEPSQASQVFTVLARNKVISKDLAERLNQAGGTRNIIVHEYLDIDLSIIYNIIQNNLPDLERFVYEIGEYLKKEGGEENV